MWLPELDCIFLVRSDKGLVEWEHELRAFVVEVGNESYYSVYCLTTFFGLFLPLR